MGSSKKVTIGYKYYIGMHLAISHPVDEVQAIYLGDRLAWGGSVTSSSSIYVNNPNLWGGEKKEGGFVGTVDIMMGDVGTVNSYLSGKLGPDIPAYRGILSLVLNKCYVTAMTRSIKKISVLVKKTSSDWYPSKSQISSSGTPGATDYIPSGSMNPIHVIYEALTNEAWGLGLSSSSYVDVDSFTAAADILYDEHFGISMQMSQQDSVKEFIRTVLTQISAMLYTNKVTGKFAIKLIREPTTEELDNAILIDEDVYSEISNYERPSQAEIINEVIVKYRPQKALKDSSVNIQDLASVESQLGIISQTTHFPGIDNETIAKRVALRELNQMSNPLVKIDITGNRKLSNLEPGSIAKFSSTELGIENMIIRIFSVNNGTLQDGSISINAVEDVFSMPSTTYLAAQSSFWTDPVGAPAAVTTQLLFETPYWELNNILESYVFENLDDLSSYVQYIAEVPSIASPNYQLWTTPASSYVEVAQGSYVESLQILGAITEQTTDVTVSASSFIQSSIFLPTYAYIGNEVVIVNSISDTSINISRGMFDTIPEPHAILDKLYFVNDGDALDPTEYSEGDTIKAKALTQTDIGILDIGSATEITKLLLGRQGAPYPPANVKINGSYFPTTTSSLIDTVITWGHQDRTQQLAPLDSLSDWFTTSLGSPEAGVEYTVLIYDESDVLISTNAGITTNSFDYTQAQELSDSGVLNSSLRVEIFSTRSGIDSLQIFNHTVTRV